METPDAEKHKKFDVVDLPHNTGVFLACRKLADANDINELLELHSEHEFVRVGYTGIWLANESTLDFLNGCLG